MITGSKNRVQTHGTVEITFGSAQITQIVFGYAPEKEIVIIGGIESGKDIKIFNRQGIFTFRQRVATS
jgi:hypothetical protein